MKSETYTIDGPRVAYVRYADETHKVMLGEGDVPVADRADATMVHEEVAIAVPESAEEIAELCAQDGAAGTLLTSVCVSAIVSKQKAAHVLALTRGKCSVQAALDAGVIARVEGKATRGRRTSGPSILDVL